MRSFFSKKFYCCLFVFTVFAAKAQTNFSATVSPSQAGRDEYITLKLTVANGENVQNIQPPALDAFNIISGPNQESEMSSMNGVSRQSISVSYVLMARKSGSYTIGPASAVINGKNYKSNPVNITVTNKRSSPQQQQNNAPAFSQSLFGLDPFDEPKPETNFDDYILHKGDNVPEKVNRNMQLRLQADKTTCYVGEPVLAWYKLFTRLKSESSLSKNPSFNGFSVIDLTQQADPGTHTQEKLEGRLYNVYTIRKAQLYPLQAGDIVLETASLDNKIEFLSSSASVYDPGNIVTENVTLSSRPLTIHVKPLPEEGKPADFKGAVGNFKLESALEKNNFSTDETGKLLINISGSGNMQLVTAPDIKWPDGFEAFDTKYTDNTDKNTVPVSGNKVFEIPFTVEKPGTYNTPAISFSYFDPVISTYRTVHTAPQTFTVIKGNGKSEFNVAVTDKKSSGSLLNSIFENRPVVILILTGIIICGIIFWASKEKKEESATEKISPEPLSVPENDLAVFTAQHPLLQTEECLHTAECKTFYAILNGELRDFFSKRFSVPKDFLTSKTLALAMDKAGIENTVILQVQQLLQDIEWQLYTPSRENELLHQTYARAQTIVQQLNMANG